MPLTATLILAADDDAPRVLPVTAGSAAACSVRCPGKQTDNEDAALLLEVAPGTLVLAVADGLGGIPGGATAARTALETLATQLGEHADPERDLRGPVLEAFEAANDAVLALGGPATTLSVAAVQKGLVRSFHAGDSVTLVFGQRGRVRYRSTAHSPTDYAVQAGMLHEDDALLHEDRNLVLHCLGARDMRIEVGNPLTLRRHDTVLLASDGLVDNLYLDEIVARARAGRIEDAVGRLARECHVRMRGEDPELPGNPDDLTILAWRPYAPRSQENSSR